VTYFAFFGGKDSSNALRAYRDKNCPSAEAEAFAFSMRAFCELGGYLKDELFFIARLTTQIFCSRAGVFGGSFAINNQTFVLLSCGMRPF
jgi:hypothetical protein